ncbi:MAG: putative lipid II flippase FtsW [Gammaproteobacteria bacterium]
MHSNQGIKLFWICAVLVSIGVVMVGSSSIAIATARAGDPFYYLTRQIAFLSVGLVIASVVYHVPIATWSRFAKPILGIAFIVLILLLIPGVGHKVNGSLRWIKLGPVNIQASEVSKLALIIYFAYFCSQYQEELRTSFKRLMLGLLPLGAACGLILLQPDFGAVVVLSTCVLSLFFMAGISLWYVIGLVALAGGSFAFLAISAPYRLERITTFLNPWADQFDSGYQLTQALIAFGRGQWIGLGLGSGVQKLFYLPEAHTDFIFAVIAEETGFVGAASVLLLYVLFGVFGCTLAWQASCVRKMFHAYLAFALTLWIVLQALIAMAVNIGLLPTKGLTLPFVSYGGSSLVVFLAAAAILLRINKEL